MSTSLTVECEFRVDRRGRGSRKVLETGPRPFRPAQPGRVPRVAKLMALAIRCEGLIRDGVVESYSEIARLGHVTRARVSQIMNLLNLAPDLQEALLFLPRVGRGRDPLILADLQPVASTPDWRRQRRLWADLAGRASDLPRPAGRRYLS